MKIVSLNHRKVDRLKIIQNKFTLTSKRHVISMEIIHVSAECFPVAKAGGLGDVVGALPKYQNELGHYAKVVMPMYRTKFLFNNEWELVMKADNKWVSTHSTMLS